MFTPDDARPGAAPVCPACATALAAFQPSLPGLAVAAAPPPRPRRRVLIGAGVVLALLAALAAAAAARWFML